MNMLTMAVLAAFALMTAGFMGIVAHELAGLAAGLVVALATLGAEVWGGRTVRRLMHQSAESARAAATQQPGGSA